MFKSRLVRERSLGTVLAPFHPSLAVLLKPGHRILQEVIPMYESQFLLKRRPFAATPDPRCFLGAGPVQAALDELVVCVEQGQGVAVVSAPAGTGKTLLSERLRMELDSRFEVIFLRHASFLTRRALLQSILADLNHAYRRHDEQELRLELVPAIRALNPRREALVLLCDEAHMLNEDLLEELRILADLAEQGRPLVRLVLIGQPGLEETLARPGLEALNQRIRAHVCLDSFDRAAALDYIDYRITWAGGRTDEIFTAEALDLICRASEGVPRRINQLCDHALLLAYVAEEKPVRSETILEALQDLRQLPLHWNESFLADEPRQWQPQESAELGIASHGDSTSFEPECRFAASVTTADQTDSAVRPCPAFETVMEFGADVPRPETAVESRVAHETGVIDAPAVVEVENPDVETVNLDFEIDSDDRNVIAETENDEAALEPERTVQSLLADVQSSGIRSFMMMTPPSETVSPASETETMLADVPVRIRKGEVEEELVCDRYAAIDGGFPVPVPTVSVSQPWSDGPETTTEESGLDTTESAEVRDDSTTTETSSQVWFVLPESAERPSEQSAVVDHVENRDEFETVCTRLDTLIPEVHDNPGWDSAILDLDFRQQRPGQVDALQTENSADDWGSLEAELGMDVCDLASEVHGEIQSQTERDGTSAWEQLQQILGNDSESTCIEVGATEQQSSSSREGAATAAPVRPYRNLFSLLRRKQQGLL